MKRLTRILLLTFSLALSTVASNAQCVRFESIDHCPIGNATLTLSPDGTRLAAIGLGPEGSDGVASKLDTATSWQARIRNVGLAPGDHFTLTSVADGFDTSTMRYEVATGGGLDVTAEFTGALGPSHYTLWLLDDDEEEPPYEGPGGLVPGTTIHIEFIDPFENPPIEDEVDNGFHVGDGGLESAVRSAVARRSSTAYRSCSFVSRFADRVRVWVDGSLVGTADEILLLEDADAPGHYNYTQFDGMHIESSGNAIVIKKENFISNGF